MKPREPYVRSLCLGKNFFPGTLKLRRSSLAASGAIIFNTKHNKQNKSYLQKDFYLAKPKDIKFFEASLRQF